MEDAATGERLEISSRRGRAVVSFLALQRAGSAPRDRLTELFWTDRAEAQAKASLRQCLIEVKAALGSLSGAILDVSRSTIGLKFEALLVDVHEIEQALDGRDAARLGAALTQIGSDVLLDERAVSESHQEWIDQVRAHVERKLASGAATILKGLLATDPELARTLADAILRRLPLDEDVVAAAMLADLAHGAASAAVLRFATLKVALRREVGVAPGGTVQAALQAVLNASASEVDGPKPRPSVETSAAPMIVVAVFEAASSLDEGWSSTVREEILAGLARFRELRVVAQSTPGAGEAWTRRAGAYLLTGLSQGQTGRVRLVIQLIRCADDEVVWSERAALDAVDAEQVIDRTVARVVGAMLPAIQDDLLPRLPQGSGDAFTRYWRARDLALRAETFSQAKIAAEELEALIKDAPAFSLPYLPLARLYNTDFAYTRAGSTGPEHRQRAFDLAKTALAIDRSHVHGYTVMGWCYLWRGGWEAARRHFTQAVELNPFNADRLMEVGFGSLFLGDLSQARSLLERCLLLNPAPKDGFFMDLGLLELLSGRYDLAQTHFDMIARPTVFDALYSAANAVLAGTPHPDQSGRSRRRVEAIWPPERRPDAERIGAWFYEQHPFEDESVRRRLAGAVQAAMASAGDLHASGEGFAE